MGEYDIGLACLNGHPINDSVHNAPEQNTEHCSKCGERTICACSTCDAPIRGYYYSDGVMFSIPWRPADYCYKCGAAYPWTDRRREALTDALDELEELDDEEREKLKKSIPDILTETPRSEAAVLRFKKAAGKIGDAGGKVLMNVLNKVASDAVKSMLGL